MENKQTELKYLYDKAIGDLVKCSLRIKELEAENRRLQTERDSAFERWKTAIAKYPNGAEGCACLFDENENPVNWCSFHAALREENRRLRELVDGARVIVEVFQWSTPAQERWREEWLKKAAKALKEASHD